MTPKTLAELRGNMSQRELARKLKLSPSTIAMYEIGARTPSLETAKLIAKFFGVPVEGILFGAVARKKRAEMTTGTYG